MLFNLSITSDFVIYRIVVSRALETGNKTLSSVSEQYLLTSRNAETTICSKNFVKDL